MKSGSLMIDDDDEPVSRNRTWSTYLGVTGLLLVLGHAGWRTYLVQRQENGWLCGHGCQAIDREDGDQIADRIKLLYEPMFAIVGVGSLVPEFTAPAVKGDTESRRLMLRALGIYPQILSLYVGFDSGDFLMVTHVTLRVPKR